MYTYKDVERIVRSNTEENLESKFTKQQLTDMYMAIYHSKPLSAFRKQNIAITLKSHFHQIDRTLAFNL